MRNEMLHRILFVALLETFNMIGLLHLISNIDEEYELKSKKILVAKLDFTRNH
jgi:hypothetical protein